MADIMRDAQKRIEDIRRRTVKIVVRRDGSPVPDAQVELRMNRHQFLFGCDCYCANTYDTPEKEKQHKELFSGLFNYATLPFYWGQYEPVRGEKREKRLSNMVEWCKSIDLSTKGHPLVWHEILPDWLNSDHDIEKLIQERIEDLMERFGDQIDYWDLFNEITVSQRFHNPVADWIEKVGKENAVEYAARCVYEVNPRANLLYNDFNVQPADMEILLRKLREKGIRLEAVGLQSHMHQRKWSFDETWEICERYAKYGWPIHFTELTVINGRCTKDVDYTIGNPNFCISRPEDLEIQREYTEQLYTLLFSHPAVEAITWWDFPDRQWMDAPGGLITEDLKIKPVYDGLKELIKKRWWSNEEGRTNLSGCFASAVYCGNYDITVKAGNQAVSLNTDILRKFGVHEGAQKLVIEL